MISAAVRVCRVTFWVADTGHGDRIALTGISGLVEADLCGRLAVRIGRIALGITDAGHRVRVTFTGVAVLIEADVTTAAVRVGGVTLRIANTGHCIRIAFALVAVLIEADLERRLTVWICGVALRIANASHGDGIALAWVSDLIEADLCGGLAVRIIRAHALMRIWQAGAIGIARAGFSHFVKADVLRMAVGISRIALGITDTGHRVQIALTGVSDLVEADLSTTTGGVCGVLTSWLPAIVIAGQTDAGDEVERELFDGEVWWRRGVALADQVIELVRGRLAATIAVVLEVEDALRHVMACDHQLLVIRVGALEVAEVLELLMAVLDHALVAEVSATHPRVRVVAVALIFVDAVFIPVAAVALVFAELHAVGCHTLIQVFFREHPVRIHREVLPTGLLRLFEGPTVRRGVRRWLRTELDLEVPQTILELHLVDGAVAIIV